MCGVARRVAISVGVVGCGALGGVFLAPWRLHKLPDRCVGYPACGYWRRILRRAAPRGRWADIVVDPVDEFTVADVVANVVGSENGRTAAFVDRNCRAVHARAVASAVEFVGPGAQIYVKAGREPAAILDIKKNNCVRSKAFRFRGGCGIARVENSLLSGGGVLLDLVRLASAIEGSESETLQLELGAFAAPGVDFFAWRRAEPVAGEGKSLAQDRESVIARVDVTVETEIGGVGGRMSSHIMRSHIR